MGSLDIKSLYPSLTKEWVEKVLTIIIMLMKTEVVVDEQVNWEELGVYLATIYSQQELDEKGLGNVVPR